MEGIYIYTVQWKTVYIHSVFQQIKAQTVLIETLVSWTALEWLHAGQGHRQKVYRLPCRLHWRDEHCFPGVKEKSIDVQKTHVSDTQSWCARTNWGKNRDRAANSCTSKKIKRTWRPESLQCDVQHVQEELILSVPPDSVIWEPQLKPTNSFKNRNSHLPRRKKKTQGKGENTVRDNAVCSTVKFQKHTL